jgi:hypothetical protein
MMAMFMETPSKDRPGRCLHGEIIRAGGAEAFLQLMKQFEKKFKPPARAMASARRWASVRFRKCLILHGSPVIVSASNRPQGRRTRHRSIRLGFSGRSQTVV